MLTTLPLSDLAVSDFGQAHSLGQVDTAPRISLNGPSFRAAINVHPCVIGLLRQDAVRHEGAAGMP